MTASENTRKFDLKFITKNIICFRKILLFCFRIPKDIPFFRWRMRCFSVKFARFLKRDSNKGVFLWNLQFEEHLGMTDSENTKKFDDVKFISKNINLEKYFYSVSEYQRTYLFRWKISFIPLIVVINIIIFIFPKGLLSILLKVLAYSKVNRTREWLWQTIEPIHM